MLERIQLENFKVCRDVDVRLAKLTILAGMNSSGKSSLLQALCALHQSYAPDGRTDGFFLYGPLVQLGKYGDLLSENSLTDAISITVTESGQAHRWSCKGAASANQLDYVEHPDPTPGFVISSEFQFLHADRIVPETFYPQASRAEREGGALGAHGEFTADFLERSQGLKVSPARGFSRSDLAMSDDLLSKVAPTDSLLDQVAGWIQHISPGAKLQTDSIGGTDEVRLQFGYFGKAKEARSNFYRPTNVGFGLTYSLPVIVACLAAKSGALLLFENPEAHLHPRGQSALGSLLARCASDGVQIIVESHSDHLLNGVRLAVKKGLIKKDDVVIHFFTREVETGDAFVQSPAILDNGRLTNWPEGFFDQWDRDVDALLE